MLPMMSNLKTKVIAGSVAVAMLATSAAPALAWSRDDQMFTRGVGATLLLGYLLSPHPGQARPGPVYQPAPVYRPAPIYQPAPVYQQPPQYGYYREREHHPRPPIYVPAPQPSIYNSPAAYTFSGYSMNERRRIQATLTNYGYYHGGLDGNFGPGTYDAIYAFARQTGRVPLLNTQAGAANIFDSLLG